MPKNVLVGCVVFGYNTHELKVLLRDQRIPAAVVGMNDSTDDIVKKILRDCLGDDNTFAAQYKCFSLCDEGRDTICVVYVALVNTNQVYLNDLKVSWYSVLTLSWLTNWEQDILAGARVWLKEQLAALPIGYRLLPRRFTLLQLRSLLELVLQRKFDRANFSKKINSLNFIKRSKKRFPVVGNRPAHVYTFDLERIQHASDRFTFEVGQRKSIL